MPFWASNAFSLVAFVLSLHLLFVNSGLGPKTILVLGGLAALYSPVAYFSAYYFTVDAGAG